MESSSNFKYNSNNIIDNYSVSIESSRNSEEIKCEICFEVITIKAYLKSCKHYFCLDCMKEFLTTQINQMKFPIKCPGNSNKCIRNFEYHSIVKIIESKMKDKYIESSLKKYIETLGHDKFFYCPTAGCPYGCEYDTVTDQFTCPVCNKKFCLKCKTEYHNGYKCKISDEFIKFAKKEKLKECPKCKTWIEKNQGCNHMTCIICKYEFCYICGEQSYISHTNCNYKFETSDKRAMSNNLNNTQSLDRISVPNHSNRTYNNDTSGVIREQQNLNQLKYFINYQNERPKITLISKIGPLKKDGTLDMRYSINKDLIKNNSASYSISSNNSISNYPQKKDGTLDMRYSINKEYIKMQNHSIPSNFNYASIGNGPLKKDGTLDMRYKVNKMSSSISSYSGFSGLLKKNGTPDMRYACNRKYKY